MAIAIYASGTRTLLHHNLNWISRVRESSMVTATHIQSVSSPTIREKDLHFELSVFSYGKQHHGQSAMMLEQFSWWDKLARSNSKVGSVIDSTDLYTAISRKVVGKSARDNPERYCGWFWKLCSSKKFEKMAQETTNICLRVLKESNKSMFDSYSHQDQCIDHIPYYLSGLSRAYFFRQPFSK